MIIKLSKLNGFCRNFFKLKNLTTALESDFAINSLLINFDVFKKSIIWKNLFIFLNKKTIFNWEQELKYLWNKVLRIVNIKVMKLNFIKNFI
jgi:hypothetical protein